MVLIYSNHMDSDFSISPTGSILYNFKKLSPKPVGEFFLTAHSADKPDDAIPVRVRHMRLQGDEIFFVAESPVFSIDGRIIYISDAPHIQIRLNIVSRGVSGAYRLSVHFKTALNGEPRFMIPGIFYKNNRPEGCLRRYPAFSSNPPGASDPFLSPYWAFRADRAAEPAVFIWDDDFYYFLSMQPYFAKGLSGLFFRSSGDAIELGLNYPYVEEPMKYSFCHETGTAPEHTFFHLKRGEEFSITFDFRAGKRDLHSYASSLRFIYERDRKNLSTFPWMGADAARALAASGLYRWHFDDAEGCLWETAAFDKYFGRRDKYYDRMSMHTAWSSGAPTAMALLWQGRVEKNDNYVYAGVRVLDKVASGIAPCGTFYSCWSSGKGWTGGWNPSDKWTQARVCAEATLFLLRALRLECKYGQAHPNWLAAAKKSLDFAVSIQRADGNFGAFYDAETGAVAGWEGSGGLLWIAALLAGYSFGGEKRYRDAALGAGEYYSRFIEDEFLYGAPENVHLTPSSEDGANALVSYLMLAEMAREERWFALAHKAADWLLTFRFSYNSRMPQHAILSTYHFHTKGGDIASPAHQHLHFSGLGCHPELMRLGRYLEDSYYTERAREHLEFCHQFIAREEGDFGARRGMVPEQFYHTDWRQPKGHVLALSHAWCAGLILYANLWEKEHLGESTLRLNQLGQSPNDNGGAYPVSTITTEELPMTERDTLFDG